MNCLCRPSKTITVRIILLDETEFLHELKDDVPAQTLLEIVFERLNLIETAYFSLRYLDAENQTHWLDPNGRISRQLNGSADIYDLYFGVKFYAADPTKLIEEITRYQLFLQVKQDVLQGRLPVTFELAAELGAYIVQSELGDYDNRRHSIGYVSEFRLVANQSKELESRVTELHQQLKGMSPSVAELNYLEKVKWHDMYGVDLHSVLGEDNVEYYLGLTPSGIIVLRSKTTVAYYFWPRIAKVYFKGRYFMLRVCDKNNDVSTYGFETPRKSACRHLWRCCVEHHAFFRLVCVSPMQSPEGPSELFAFGSRFRYSGRTEKQAVRDAMEHGRSPPPFKRTPSRRQPRRSNDEPIDTKNFSNNSSNIIKSISIPQPAAQVFESPYRSTYKIPTSLAIRPYSSCNSNSAALPDSPRSTRSAPWNRSQQKGLFGVNTSPRSVRSTSTRKSDNVTSQQQQQHRYRSSSVESHSSTESRSCRKHRHRNKRTSDNESELSRGSGRSHSSHRKHRRQRSRHKRNDSGSENESTKARSLSGHRKLSHSNELIDSNVQWIEVQKKRADNIAISSVQQASVMKSSLATKYQSTSNDNNSNETRSNSSNSQHKSKRSRKNKSPSDGHSSRVWSSELAKHLQFDLVDTTGMSEDQLREIPYTVIETNSNSKRSNGNSLKVHRTISKDRVDRIRGIYIPETNTQDATINGSIRSASTLSSRDCDKNAGLVRLMSSLSMVDFISPSGSSLSPLDNSGIRVSHEHTDSGLGADQDYAYSSERSSDSAKYGTNKSSGASVTSGNHQMKFSKPPNTINNTHESVSNRKPPLHPNHQLFKNMQSTTSSAVHNSNNRLPNNTIFHNNNNHYTFCLNRNGDGYLESIPISYASLFSGDNIKVTRGTKSDIGVPCRKIQSTAQYSNNINNTRLHSSSNNKSNHNINYNYYNHNNNNNNNIHNNNSNNNNNINYGNNNNNINNTNRSSTITTNNKLPSFKSDMLLSYLNNSQNALANNLTSSIHYISDGIESEYLENVKRRGTNINDINIHNNNHNISSNSFISKSIGNKIHYNINDYNSIGNSNAGPLLYLDSEHNNMGTQMNNNHNHNHNNNNKYQSTKNNTPCSEGNLIGDNTQKQPQSQTKSSSPAKLPNRSNSLELILTPIIQSSKRVQ